MKLRKLFTPAADGHHLGCGVRGAERRHGLYRPFTFVFARNVIGGLVLLPVIAVLGKAAVRIRSKRPRSAAKPANASRYRRYVLGKELCAGSTQQFALLGIRQSARPDSSPRATS